MYIGAMMLVPKLLRLDDATIQEIDKLVLKLSEKEYISFSALVRTLIRKGLDDMTKSIINSEQLKKVVHDVVDKALEECAYQQEANGMPYEGFDCKNLNEYGLPTSMGLIEPNVEMKEFSNTKPTQAKITIEFYFGEETHKNKHGKLVCMPVIDLTNIK
jgi:hypothetical protein